MSGRQPEPARGLKFYPDSHRYKLDGAWVQGVTTLIGQGLPKGDALTKWAARSVAEYVADNPDQVERLKQMGRAPMVGALGQVPWQTRDEAAIKGTDVHRYAEQIVHGGEVDVPEHLVPHVESCIAFLEDFDIRPLLVEACVGSRKYRYAGKLDLVAEHNRGPGLAIFDYKTAKSGIWPETAFQLSAYAHAEFYGEAGDEKPLPPIQGAYGVHLRADGYDAYPLRFGEDVFQEFLAITEVARIAKRAKGDRNSPGYVGPAVQPLEEVPA